MGAAESTPAVAAGQGPGKAPGKAPAGAAGAAAREEGGGGGGLGLLHPKHTAWKDSVKDCPGLAALADGMNREELRACFTYLGWRADPAWDRPALQRELGALVRDGAGLVQASNDLVAGEPRPWASPITTENEQRLLRVLPRVFLFELLLLRGVETFHLAMDRGELVGRVMAAMAQPVTGEQLARNRSLAERRRVEGEKYKLGIDVQCRTCSREVKAEWAPEWSRLLFCDCKLPAPEKEEPAAYEDADLESFLVDVACCTACRELFEDPVVLPCKHRVCRACVLETEAHDAEGKAYAELSCPLCREGCGRTRPGTDRLLENVCERMKMIAKQSGTVSVAQLEKLLVKDVELPNLLCDICSDRGATAKCLQCRLNYCARCRAAAHPNKGGLRDHHLVAVTSLAGLGAHEAVRFCAKHPDQQLTRFDAAGNRALCPVCAADAGAATEGIVEARRAFDAAVREQAEALAGLRAGAVASVRDVEAALHAGLVEHSKAERGRVYDAFRDVRLFLQRKERELIGALNAKELALRERLRAELAAEVKRAEALARARAFGEACLEEPDIVDFVQGARLLGQDLQDAADALAAGPAPHDFAAEVNCAAEQEAALVHVEAFLRERLLRPEAEAA